MPRSRKLLLTGPPGCGKRTVVCRVIEAMPNLRPAGFYTREVRRQGHRLGFEAIGLAGCSAVLAHVDFHRPRRVGGYGVELDGFEAIVRAELGKAFDQVDLLVIDEIGKMECLSRVFVEAATGVLDGPVPVLATIAAKGRGLIGQVKARRNAELLVVSAGNRDDLPVRRVTRLRST